MKTVRRGFSYGNSSSVNGYVKLARLRELSECWARRKLFQVWMMDAERLARCGGEFGSSR